MPNSKKDPGYKYGKADANCYALNSLLKNITDLKPLSHHINMIKMLAMPTIKPPLTFAIEAAPVGAGGAVGLISAGGAGGEITVG